MCFGSPDIPEPKKVKTPDLPTQRVHRQAQRRVDPQVIQRRMSQEAKARETVKRSRAGGDRSLGPLETSNVDPQGY